MARRARVANISSWNGTAILYTGTRQGHLEFGPFLENVARPMREELQLDSRPNICTMK